ncbi:hypothetical protein [uncultured Alistipes sp.]|uniref:hypothetical protein n=1 Tax=uncultured Alistipes sp. TaxID=538949 RepID=UPI0025B1ABA1|nr:hypothetical protein [uncultured Alistipes sp.]
MLIPVIAQYLRSHRRLIIPQMGAFIVKEPGQSVLFSELLKRDDGVLRSLLVAAGSSELEAGGEIDRFVFEVRHAIQQGREFPLEGLGVLKPGPNETIAFTYVPQPAEPTAATTDAAATASANTAVASDAPAAGAAVSAEPTTDIRTGKVTAAAVEALYDGNRPAREPEQAPAARPASGPAFSAPKPSEAQSADTATSDAPKPSEPQPTETPAFTAPKPSGPQPTAPTTPIAERRFSGRADFASPTEQSSHPQFKSLSLPKRTKRDDTLVDSYYGRLPRRPAIEQTVRVRKRSDHFIWIALAAALIALGAIAFGQWCDKFGREGDEVILEHISTDDGYMPSGR